MADLNTFAFTGRLTKDAQLKNVNGKSLVELDIANNTGYGDYAKTNWLKVKWWGDRAANALSIFTKGSLVGGYGEANIETYTGKNGQDYTNLAVTVFGLQLLSKPKNNTSEQDVTSEADVSEDVLF